MNKIIGIIFSIVLFSCEPEKPVEYVTVKKVVRDKKQATKTEAKYKYNWWKGAFYHIPDVHEAFYIVYYDGSFDEVDIGKYTITNIGDTITLKLIK